MCIKNLADVTIGRRHAWHVDYLTVEDQNGTGFVAGNSTITELYVNE